jgi:glycosyltransferase involved in cell wall biosynthesis
MKLSVAMITYNQERFIGQAIESVLGQKVSFDYEIVIGEDCSTDGTRGVILDFQRRYPERIVSILRERNVGAMRNFAETIAACRGQYLAFLEGDDYWTSVDKLQRQVDFLDAHPDRVLCCHRAKFLYETGSAEVDVHPHLAAGPYTIEDLLKMNFVMTCSTVLRRELIGPLPRWFFEVKMGDWPLFALVARYGKIELMDEIMATYRVHPGGTWSSLPRMTQLREVVRMLRLLDKHLGFQYTNAIRQAITWLYLELAMTARSNGKRVETGKHLVSSIRYGGLRVGISLRTFAGLAAFALIGSWYKVFSRAKSASNG